MYRIIIINVLHNVIVHQVGHLTRVIPGCMVSKILKKKKIVKDVSTNYNFINLHHLFFKPF